MTYPYRKIIPNLKKISIFQVLLLTCLLNACSTLTFNKTSPPINYINWQQIQEKIRAQTHWRLIGKIGIRTPIESFTAAINKWDQSDDLFEINISSTFFGLGASTLRGNGKFLTLIESGEDPISSNKPNELIESALGFPLPITHLPYWIKGLPAPNQTFEIEFNKQGLPSILKQHQWKLHFSKYQLEQGIPLPGKIKLERNDTRIILAIKKWTLL